MCAIPARASSHHRPRDCGKLSPRRELACGRAQIRHARRELAHPTTAHSAGYWRWREKKAHRWVVSARYRIAHPKIAHERLWLCIHHGEGAWNDEDSGHNGHYGGLQMTPNWGWNQYAHYGLPGYASSYSPYQQMAAAERGYKTNSYSLAWLKQQWYHPECFTYA